MDKVYELTGDLAVEQLLELYNVVRVRRRLRPLEVWHGTRERLVFKIEKYERKRWKATHPRKEYMRKQAAAERQRVKYRGVGKFVKGLLAEVIGHDEEGHPLGHSYMEILKKTKAVFPESAVDKKHVTWYCNKMREMGEQPPVYRERSKWK